MSATLSLNAGRRELSVALGGGDQVPDHIVWSTSPKGYIRLTPLASEADVAGLFPILPGVVTCTASLRDAFNVEIQSVAVKIQVTGADAETMQLSTTSSAETVPTPYTPPPISSNVSQQAHEAAASAPAALTSVAPAAVTSDAVAGTASTSTTPFGYAQAQADDIVAELNAVVADAAALRTTLAAVQADTAALRGTLAALVAAHNVLVAAMQAATILHT